MARLTERTEDGEWWLRGLPWQSIFEGHELTRTDHRLLYGALCKLRDYEDTGLEPGEVRAQKAENQLLKDALVKSATPGKWLPVDGAVDMARCSVCGECADIGWEPLTKYAKEHRFCSHCGAKMDGGKKMLINLPHIAPIDTDKGMATLESQVRYSFAKYTELTAADYTHQDKLCYIDNLTRAYIRRLDASRQVREMIHDAVDYSIDNNGTMPDDDELLSWEFMEACYEAGERDCRLYRHYIDGRNKQADERALKVIAEIVKIVMNWEPEEKEHEKTTD